MKGVVFLNGQAGTALKVGERDLAARIRAAFAAAGADVEVLTLPAADLTDAARKAAQEVDVVVAAGGDGTVQSVARGVLGTRAALAILPVGTFNHFAKELQMPLEVGAAATAIAHGKRQQYPVPLVNGRLFVSSAAMGLYARAIRHREAQRRALQRSKPLAMLIAVWQAIRRPTFRRVRLEIDDATLHRLTPSVVVACNEYLLRVMGLTEEFHLDRSQLNVVITRAETRFGVIRLVIRVLAGRLQNATETLTGTSARLRTRHRRESVVLDGELTALDMPLEFAMSPVPLTVIVPPPALRNEAPALFVIRR